jgi:hypothetical protein
MKAKVCWSCGNGLNDKPVIPTVPYKWWNWHDEYQQAEPSQG